ncbi:MAG: hypothetical protein K2H16_01395 [Prevotella sp.]|nr:hypothetical protein [Prevotella sp.]
MKKLLKKVTNLLTELEDKGLLRKDRIIFDSMQDDEVTKIFDRHMAMVPNSKTYVK